MIAFKENWGGKRESNPQPSEPQSGALPVELFPPQEIHYSNWESGCQKLYCAVPTGLALIPEFAPGTSVPGFRIPPLRGCVQTRLLIRN